MGDPGGTGALLTAPDGAASPLPSRLPQSGVIKCPPKPRNPCAFDYEPGSQAHPPVPPAPRGPPARAPEPRGQLARATELQLFGHFSFVLPDAFGRSQAPGRVRRCPGRTCCPSPLSAVRELALTDGGRLPNTIRLRELNCPQRDWPSSPSTFAGRHTLSPAGQSPAPSSWEQRRGDPPASPCNRVS